MPTSFPELVRRGGDVPGNVDVKLIIKLGIVGDEEHHFVIRSVT